MLRRTALPPNRSVPWPRVPYYIPEPDLIGRDLVEALGFSDDKPVELAREWGVRRLGEQLSIRTRAGNEKRVVADVFPAYDDDGGLLIALTPTRG
jgi:hypothetical protein